MAASNQQSHKSYDDGVRDGKIEALEATSAKHSERLDRHSKRIALLEKAAWVVLGIVLAIQLVPEAKDFIRALGA